MIWFMPLIAIFKSVDLADGVLNKSTRLGIRSFFSTFIEKSKITNLLINPPLLSSNIGKLLQLTSNKQKNFAVIG